MTRLSSLFWLYRQSPLKSPKCCLWFDARHCCSALHLRQFKGFYFSLLARIWWSASAASGLPPLSSFVDHLESHAASHPHIAGITSAWFSPLANGSSSWQPHPLAPGKAQRHSILLKHSHLQSAWCACRLAAWMLSRLHVGRQTGTTLSITG